MVEVAVGSVIRLRNRVWRVDRVEEDEFAATPLDGRDTRRWRFLRSLEEANAESGSVPPPSADSLGDPATQDLYLRAYRLGLIHGSAPFLGLQRSRAIPEPYQLVPLLMSLDMARVRLLIGDDVGIGKSIEAGLIVSELLARGAAERLLVVVPASLREQWQETLQRFFHLDATIISGSTRPALERQLLPGQSPWETFPVVISSIDYLKRRIGEVLSYRWDIVLCDEAHIAARPHQGAYGSPADMERWEFLKAVGQSERVRHLLLLSATPHPGYTDRFASLLEAIEPAAVHANGQIDREVATRHVVQRRRKDIEAWYGSSAPFPTRAPAEQIIALTRAEDALFTALRAYCDRLSGGQRAVVSQWVALHLQRRALSSPAAIRESLRRRSEATARQAERKSEHTSTPDVEAEAAVLDEDSFADLSDEDRWERMDTSAVAEAEAEELRGLIALAKSLTSARDGKLVYLKKLLPNILARHSEAPRALVFTRYTDTLDYLAKELEKEAKREGPLQGLSVFRIDGTMNQVDRRRVYREFESTPRAVCIATDCISEGLDLQTACAELVHYELPWNPNRLEQRNGRLDRYGQPEPEVGILTLVRDYDLDIAILNVLVRKAERIRADHGFCPAIFSSPSDLKRLIRRYGYAGQLELPLYDESPVEDEPDPFESEQVQRIMDESFYGQADVRLHSVEEALRQTHDAVGSPEEVRSFVLSALNAAHASVTQVDGDVHEVDLRGSALVDAGEVVRATFSPILAREDPNLECLSIAHPLVRRLIEFVQRRAQGIEAGRVAARGSDQVREVTAVFHILARYVTASDPPVLMEELIPLATHPFSNSPVVEDPLALIRSDPSPTAHAEAALRKMAEDALSDARLDAQVREAVEARRQLLEARQRDIGDVSGEWARGMERVSIASVDILSITLVVPAR